MKGCNKHVLPIITLIILFIVIGTSGVAAETSGMPSDATGTKYEEAFTKLFELKIFEGTNEGKFEPNGQLTRAQFAKIAVSLAGKTDAAEQMKEVPAVFSDVKVGAWYTGYINMAYKIKIIRGDPPKTDGTRNFRPGDPVKYAEAAKMLVAALGYGPASEEWPDGYVTAASEIGLLSGVDFHALMPAIRGEIALMIKTAVYDVPAATGATIARSVFGRGFSTQSRGNQPSDLVISPDGSRVYVTAMGTHNVFVVDTKTDLVTEVIDLWEGGFDGAWPFRLAVTPDGAKIYVANMFSDNISVIDTGTNRVTATIDLGRFAHDVVFTLGGQFAYVDLGWDRLSVIDVRTDKIVRTVGLEQGDRTYTLAVSRDGRKVFAASQAGGGRIYVIDAVTNTLIDRFELNKKLSNQGILTVSPDGNELYLGSGIANTSYAHPEEGVNKVYVIGLAERTVKAEIGILGGPIAMRPSPDGTRGYVSTFAAKKVFEVDLVNHTVVGEMQWGAVLHGEDWKKSDLRDMAVTPDGTKLYITGWDADAVLVADLATRRVIKQIALNEITASAWDVVMSPDGKRVYVSVESQITQADSRLIAIDTATNQITDEIMHVPPRVATPPHSPFVSPDGRLLYVLTQELYVIETATNRVIRKIPFGKEQGFFYDVSVLPNQEKAYVTHMDSEYVFVLDLKTGTVSGKINVGWRPQMITLNQDGSRAYVSRQINQYDRGGLTIIDTNSDQVIATVEPPDGTTGPNGRVDMLVMSPDGSHLYWETAPDRINVLETASNRLVRTINLSGNDRINWATRGIHPSDIAFTSDNLRAYIPCGDAFYVAILDVPAGEVIGQILDVGLEPVAIAITPDDKFAYVTNKEGESISVIDLASNKVIASISVKR